MRVPKGIRHLSPPQACRTLSPTPPSHWPIVASCWNVRCWRVSPPAQTAAFRHTPPVNDPIWERVLRVGGSQSRRE